MGAQVVVARVNGDGLVEELERTLRVPHPLVLELSELEQQGDPLRSARVLELDGHVACCLLRCSECVAGGGQGRSRARREPFDAHEPLRDGPCLRVHRIHRQELLDMRQRALRLVQLVGVHFDDPREELLADGRFRRGFRGQRLLVEPGDVPQPICREVQRLEASAPERVARVESSGLLQELDDFVSRAFHLRQDLRSAAQKRSLLAARTVLGHGHVDFGEFLRLLGLAKNVLDLGERRRVRGCERQRALQIGHRPHVVAEDVAEEIRRLKEELGGDRRRKGLQALALRDALEPERELAQTVLVLRGGVQLRPRLGGERAARHRREHRVEDRFFAFVFAFGWPAKGASTQMRCLHDDVLRGPRGARTVGGPSFAP